MPIAANDFPRVAFPILRRPPGRHLFRLIAVIALGAVLACASCKRPSTQAQIINSSPTQTSPPVAETPAPSRSTPGREPRPIVGFASWYDVPPNSITRKRAGKDELTAAHNRLPYGTLLRVTHIANGKSVVVRVTDRLVSRGNTVIDLSRQAAEKLAMVSEGSARVRLEILPDDKGIGAVPESNGTAAHP